MVLYKVVEKRRHQWAELLIEFSASHSEIALLMII